MRNLSSAALDKLAARLGNEPVIILEIQWIKDGGWVAYADRDIENTVKGKILDLGSLDDVVAISNNQDSQEISVTFDDTSGEIKSILDSTDIHKRDVRVWQWFEGLDLSDKFLLFCGKINTPIEWKEGEQTVSFSIISQLEDKEFGFSPEEGQFPYIPVDLIGQPWPSCFGTPLDVPCVAIGKAVHGTSLAGLGILTGTGFYTGSGVTADDVQTARSVATQNVQKAHVAYVASAWAGIDTDEYNRYNDQRSQLAASVANAWAARLEAKAQQQAEANKRIAEIVNKGLGKNPVRILGGQLFPRGAITLDIGGGLFTGYFGIVEGVDDDLFTITSRRHPEHEEEYAAEIAEAQESEVVSGAPTQEFDYKSKVPCGKGDFGTPCQYRTYGWLVFQPYAVCKADTVLPKYFWTDAGAQVSLYGNEPITYIVSIVPGTVLSVKAFKTFNGVKHLVNVPSNYYYVENKTYGSIEAVQLVFYKTLSTITDQNWGDDVYVTFESDIGPNVVDILEYIIDLYTDFSIDNTSFDYVRERVEKFPANFAVLERKNVLDILQEIAFQARCSLRLINGIFYLTYLPEEPTSISTFTESDLEVNSMVLTCSPTEDLVTKMVVEWRVTYAASEMNKLILRHNVAFYGIHEETFEFYIYNQPDIVWKAATFWLIRKSNTWKHLKLTTFLHKLNVESLDCIMLNFEKAYVANQPIKAIVNTADFDSDNQKIDMECWLPVKFGKMEPYDFAWPADTPAEWIFPTAEEILDGRDGGGGIGEDAEGELPLEEVKDDLGPEEQFVSGGGGATSRRRSSTDYNQKPPRHDTGDKHPSDRDFKAQDVGYTGRSGEIESTTQPVSSTIHAPDTQPLLTPQDIPLISDAFILDLSKTKVRDSEHAGTTSIAYLKDLIHFNSSENRLCLKSNVTVWDTSDPEAEFDFKYDGEKDVWGAATAWLRD